MPGANPAEILQEQDPHALPDPQPPAAANYREADVQGVTCMRCAKFSFTGEIEDGDGNFVPTGTCDLWESNVRGDFVSDGFSDPNPPLDEQGNEVWDFAQDAQRVLPEIQLAGSAPAIEKDGLIVKDIMRTGEWPVIPTAAGIIRKKLSIVKDGVSNPDTGTIALSELVQNFENGVMKRVQVPLSDESNDHKNTTRLNTGFVKKLWIEERSGTHFLVAAMDITEPEIKEKMLRGTYADVSAGVPWSVSINGQSYNALLDHVCVTNKPFIDGLGPFFAASDKPNNMTVTHYLLKGDQMLAAQEMTVGEDEKEQKEDPQPEVTPPPDPEPEDEKKDDEEEEEQETKRPAPSFQQIVSMGNESIISDLALSDHYSVVDTDGDSVIVKEEISGVRWTVPIENQEEKISLAATSKWTVVEDEEKKVETPAPSSVAPRSSDEGLEVARRLREMRLSQSHTTKERSMPTLTREELDRLELSDEQRVAFQSVLDETAELRATARGAEVDRRVDELKELGLSERPGALKLYRQVMLSDDGGPAILLLSDQGKEKERLTALEILDRFIEGIKGSDEKVMLSDQALASGGDVKPPADTEEEKPLEERVAAAKQALGK